jgi:hypothetical protein
MDIPAGTEALNTPRRYHPLPEKGGTMQAILKVMSLLVGLFVLANGIWIALMPPFSDEPQGYAIIAIGLFIPVITLYVARMDDRSET